MGAKFPVLSSPIRINGVMVKNRMLTTSMSPGVGYVVDNAPTDRFINYLEAQAAGQTGMICQTLAPFKRTVEHPGISPLPGCYGEESVPGLKRMADVVHRHGGLIVGQPYFVHDWKSKTDEDESPWGPSDIAILKFMGGFKAMDLEQIDIFKKQFVNCAVVMKEAGFDGVEVMAGVGGILNRFLSRATNNRTDRYGGSLENRVRLTVEVITMIRTAVGPDYPIVVRWSPIEFVESPNGKGQTLEDSLEVVPYLEDAGIDLHNLAVGWHESSVPLTTKVIEDGHWAYIAEKIKTAARKPVATGYRETDPKVMEQILESHKADMIAGLRYSIADPEFPRKVMDDRPEDIRGCICCCRCIDDVVSEGKPLEYCGVNPRLGPEIDVPSTPVVSGKRKVMVIGSGPGGLCAAFAARERGCDVTIYEQGPRIGGCVKMSSIFSPLHERLLGYYTVALRKHPEIKVVLNTYMTPELVEEKDPDAVIVAVGGNAIDADVSGNDGRNVVTSHDFLDMLNGHAPQKKGVFNRFMWGGGSWFLKHYYTPAFARTATAKMHWPLGKRVAIIGGGLPGCELGMLLMENGRKLDIFEEQKKIGYDVGGSDRFYMTSSFKKSPMVDLHPLTAITEFTDTGVRAVDAEGHEIVAEADTIIVTLGLQSNTELYDSIRVAGRQVFSVGDCADPHRIADATKTGYRAACAIK